MVKPFIKHLVHGLYGAFQKMDMQRRKGFKNNGEKNQQNIWFMGFKNPFSVKKKEDTMNKQFIKHLVHELYNTFQKKDLQRFKNIWREDPTNHLVHGGIIVFKRWICRDTRIHNKHFGSRILSLHVC